MAGKKQFKRTGKKKAVTKKKVYKSKKPSLVALNTKMPRGAFSKFNNNLPFPETLRTKFVYNASYLFSSGSSGATTFGTSYQFRLNAPYDPFDGTTPTALNRGCAGFSQLLSATGPYKRYKVTGCLVEILGIDPFGTDAVGVDSTELGVALFNPQDTADISSVSPDDLESKAYAIVKRLSGTGSQKVSIRQFVPMYQVFGWTKQQFATDKDTTTAPYNGTPANMPYISVAIANRRGPTTATQLTVRVRMTFYTELYDRAVSNPS